MYGSIEKARAIWGPIAARCAARGITPRIGEYIAEVALIPDLGFEIEDLGQIDEHLTIWGAADALADAVVSIYPAAMEED